MFWVWLTLSVVAALIVVPVLVGFFLPELYRGSARRRIEQSADTVWESIHDFQKHPVSGRQCRGVEPGPSDDTTLPNWIEDLGSTRISVRTVESDRPRRVVREYADSVVPMTARSIIDIEPDGDSACTVNVDNETTIKTGTWHVPIFRFVMTVTRGAQRGCDEYLKNLAS